MICPGRSMHCTGVHAPCDASLMTATTTQKTGGRGMETIRAVTVRQLLRDTRGEDDGDATLDGAPVTSVSALRLTSDA